MKTYMRTALLLLFICAIVGFAQTAYVTKITLERTSSIQNATVQYFTSCTEKPPIQDPLLVAYRKDYTYSGSNGNIGAFFRE